jgi:hypothetical protein
MGYAVARGVEHGVYCKGSGQAVGRWSFGFLLFSIAFVEDAAWKTLAVLERGLLAWPYITSGEKGEVWGCWGLLGG